MKRRTSIISSILTFFFGAVVGAVAQIVIDRQIRFWEGQFGENVYGYISVGLLVLITALAVYYFRAIDNRVSSSMSAVEQQNKELIRVYGSSRYVDDAYSEGAGVTYRGNVYKELSNLVKDASEIVALSVSTIAKEELLTEVRPHRDSYFSTIERVIRKRLMSDQGIVYKRIFQFADLSILSNPDQVKKDLGERIFQHCTAIVEMEKELAAKNVSKKRATHAADADITLTFKALEAQTMTGFVVIDRKIVAIVLGGVIEQDKPYHAGAVIYEGDPTHEIVRAFLGRFEKLDDMASALPKRLFVAPTQ